MIAVDIVRLLLVPTGSANALQGPSFPERALDRIDTKVFAQIAVRRPVRPLTPETLLDSLGGIHQLQHLRAAPGSCVRLRVGHRHAEFQLVMSQAPEPLLDTHLIAVD